MRELLPQDPLQDAEARKELLQRALHAIRTHLGMEVAFIAEFANGRRKFRYVDCEREVRGVTAGAGDPLDSSYCSRIVEGTLPELVPDVSALASAACAPLLASHGVAAYLGVPIRLANGRTYGTLCVFKTTPDPTLNERDLTALRAFADMAAIQIEADVDSRHGERELRHRIRTMLDQSAFSIVYQPIMDINRGTLVGYESLSRFPGPFARTPDLWFAEAATIGLAITLETAAIEAALLALPSLPSEVYLSFNASPALVAAPEFERVLAHAPLDRLVLEITEHVTIADYETIAAACRSLRSRGLRLAVDDAGSGYASFRHILSLRPDFIKLDVTLTRAIDADAGRQALAAALIAFAKQTGSEIVAEGVETAGELDMLRSLGVTKAQGFLLGRPGALPNTQA